MKHRNPILPIHVCVPDAEARVASNGAVYLYGSRDEHTDSFCSGSYISAFSEDLSQWQYSDSPSFTTADVPWAANGASAYHSSLSQVTCFDELPMHIRKLLPDEAKQMPIQQIIAAIEAHTKEGLPKDMRLYAPDAIEKDGKMYLYFCMSDDSEGVAVADHPGGPFHDAVRLPVSGIDPAVFVDQDGAAYYYWGQFQANVARLNPDMMSIDPDSIRTGILTEETHHFHEGSSVRRRGDLYYYVFADTSRGKPTCLGYATGTSPMGPFTYRGIIIDNADCDPGSWNNHGSIAEIDGQWYVFYHRSSNRSQYARRVCMEPIFFDENGLIQEVKMTSQGAGEPYQPGEIIPAYEACECTGNCWIDTMDVPCLKLELDGKATFRYVKTAGNTLTLLPVGTGDAVLTFHMDDLLTVSTKLGESCEINIPAGLHMLTVTSNAPCALEKIHLK